MVISMKFNFRTLAAFCALSTALTGCSKDNSPSDGSSGSVLNTTDKTVVSAGAANENESSVQISEPEKANCTVTFAEDKITASGNGASVSGKTVNITKSGVYELSGTCGGCNIKINAGKNDHVTLLLNNARLTSQSGSVIDCESAEELTLFLKSGTENLLADSPDYPDPGEEPDAAVFTRSDLIISGEGNLQVEGKFGDAIKCKDALTVLGGVIGVNSADDAIIGKDRVDFKGGVLNITAGGDGIKTTNDTDAGRGDIIISGGELNVSSEADGIQAEKALTVNGGKITIISGGDAADAEIERKDEPWDFDRRGAQSEKRESAASQKGLKAGGNIEINGGELDIKSADDSIHSNANVKVANGVLSLSSCDDGIHSDELLNITGGTVTISKSYEGLEGKSIDIGGGTIDVKAADDGMNAAGGDNAGHFGFDQSSDEYYIRISGGDITVNADGDGIDSNGTIAQSGGSLTVYGPTSSGNGALDYEKSYALSGGTLIALGSMGMAQAPSTLSQPCLSISAKAAAGSKLEVRAGGEVVLETTTLKAAQSLIFSSDKLTEGTEYEIYAGEELLATVTAENGVSGNGATGQGGFHGGGFPGGFPGGFHGSRPGGRDDG